MTDSSTILGSPYADQTMLEFVVKRIVSKPDEVQITRTIDALGVLLRLQVAADDMRTIIGKAGRTVQSLRQLVRVAGAKEHQRVNLKVIEPDGSEYRGMGSTAENAFDNV